MKNFLLTVIITLAAVMNTVSGYGQVSFTTAGASVATPQADTVRGLVQGTGGPSDNITATVSGGVTIRWKVIATNFPADWLTATALGICDNSQCHNNTSNSVWNSGTSTGSAFTSANYAQGTAGPFYLSLDFTGVTTAGTYYITVSLLDVNSPYNKTVTFLVSRWATGVTNVAKSEDDILLYPNPANDEVNVVYGAEAGVKNISIYNIIGKVVKVYSPLDNSSAKLNIDNIPSGIYFIRLMDGQGHVVATRKFTRQ